jgi:hypothetical protein
MVVVAVVCVVIVAAVGGFVVGVLFRSRGRARRADTAVEPTLASPPGSGPEDSEVGEVDKVDKVDEVDDETVAARFRAPGSRSTHADGPKTAPAPPTAAYPLEVTGGPEVADEPPAPEPDPDTVSGLALVDGDDPVIIDLNHPLNGVGADEPAWREFTFEPEPDSVEHVLQALINRARFKQVGVEEVATELVERADLRGEEVSDVLAELVGRADDPSLDRDRSSELVLFNDEVPSRPGQLTDFARLDPADKKRIIIRVLCLLVARSEDQQLPPRVGAENPSTSWPLARAVWPVSSSDDETEGALPSRLAKSG